MLNSRAQFPNFVQLLKTLTKKSVQERGSVDHHHPLQENIVRAVFEFTSHLADIVTSRGEPEFDTLISRQGQLPYSGPGPLGNHQSFLMS